MPMGLSGMPLELSSFCYGLRYLDGSRYESRECSGEGSGVDAKRSLAAAASQFLGRWKEFYWEDWNETNPVSPAPPRRGLESSLSSPHFRTRTGPIWRVARRPFRSARRYSRIMRGTGTRIIVGLDRRNSPWPAILSFTSKWHGETKICGCYYRRRQFPLRCGLPQLSIYRTDLSVVSCGPEELDLSHYV